KRELGLDTLLVDDSTFYGDLFPHAVQWKGELYLEDGLHRCLRAALQQRTAVHVRVLNLDEIAGLNGGDPSSTLAEKPVPAAAEDAEHPRRADKAADKAPSTTPAGATAAEDAEPRHAPVTATTTAAASNDAASNDA